MSISEGFKTSSTKEKGLSEVHKQIELLNMSQAVNLLGSWEWDLKTNKLFWTDAMFQLRATPVSVDNCMSIEENDKLIHDNDREMVKEQFALLSRKQDVSFEYRIVAKDGKMKLISSWATMVRDDRGEPLYIRGTSQDITLQREAENKLKELNLAFAYAEEITGMGNWQFKISSNEFLLSTNLYRLLGYEPGGFESSFDKIMEFVHPDDRDKIKHALSVSSHGHLVHPVEYRVIRKDGRTRYMKSMGKLLHNIFGETVVLGTMQDITKEFDVKRELEEKSSFAELLIENSVDLIAAFDNKCRIIAWNRKCEERYKIKKADALGKHVFEVYNDLNPEQYHDLQMALKGEQVFKTGKLTNKADGLFEYFMIPLADADDKIFGVLTILHDLSYMKETAGKLNALNESLEIKNRELERSNDEMASFSYVASHDLQEPLRKIQTFTRLIIDKDFQVLSEKGKDYFHRMESAAMRMQILIDDLLTFSRTNTYPKEFKLTDLNEVLESVKRGIKESMEEKNAVIISSTLPQANIVTFQFKQLLENLLLNSLKYCKPDINPVINIRSSVFNGKDVEDLSSDKNYIRIEIQDNGIGFEPEYSEKIFELFQRLHGKHEYPGTGLGLSICRKIIQNHKGKIIANSKPGEGATFTIYIPA